MALFTEISGAPKGHKSGAQESLNFSQVHLSRAQISVFISFCIFIASNDKQLSWWPCLRKENSINIFITYIVVALPAPKCTSGAHRKLSWVHLVPLPHSAVWHKGNTTLAGIAIMIKSCIHHSLLKLHKSQIPIFGFWIRRTQFVSHWDYMAACSD